LKMKLYKRLISAVLALMLAVGLALPAAAMTETELRWEFFGLEGLLGFTFMPLRTVNRSVSVLLGYDEIIARHAENYNMPKALLQTSLLREIMHENILDVGADIVVDIYFRACALGIENLMQPVTQIFKTDDSSTGPGQIESFTAIPNINWMIEAGLWEGEPYDASNWSDRAEVWRRLRSDTDYNIENVALRHLRSARNLFGMQTPWDGSLQNLTEEQTQWMFAGYNTGSLTSSHTVACYKYYLALDSWNRGEIDAEELTQSIAAIEGPHAQMPRLQRDET